MAPLPPQLLQASQPASHLLLPTSVSRCPLQTRILQLLVSIPDRQERAALLPEAFTPADAEQDLGEADPTTGAFGGSSMDSEGEEELLSTTPLALLQVTAAAAATLSACWCAAAV